MIAITYGEPAPPPLEGIELTPDMIEAGERTIREMAGQKPAYVAASVYVAMCNAAPRVEEPT